MESHSTGGGAAGAVPGSGPSHRGPEGRVHPSLSLSLSRFLSLILFHTHTPGCLRCPEACRLRLGQHTSSSTSAFWKGVEVRGGGPQYLKPKVETSISLEPWLGHHPRRQGPLLRTQECPRRPGPGGRASPPPCLRGAAAGGGGREGVMPLRNLSLHPPKRRAWAWAWASVQMAFWPQNSSTPPLPPSLPPAQSG